MKVALRYTRFALLGDVGLMLALAVGLLGASRLGVDIQPMKWTTIFYGGVLIALAAVLSIVAVTFQIIVAFQRHSEAN